MNYTAAQTGGNWNLKTTWVQGSVPGEFDNITIPSEVTVNIPAGNDIMLNVTIPVSPQKSAVELSTIMASLTTMAASSAMAL